MVKVYKPLFELGRIVTGKTPKTNVVDYWGGNIPFITPTDIVGYNSYYQYKTERYVTKKGLDTQKATLLPANSVCFSCIASIGKACLTRTFSITNQQINSIIPNDKNDYRYILYLLRYNLPYVQMIAGGSGSGTPIISKRKFEKFKFLIEDDLKIQHRIASILSAYDSLIENNTKRIRLLEKMAENLYKEWFVRFRFPGYEKAEMENGLPKGWKVEALENLLDIRYGKDHKKLDDGDVPIYGSGGIIRYGNTSLYNGSSVLIPRKGSLNNIIYVEGKFWTVDTMFYSVPQKNNICFYLYYVLSMVDMTAYNAGAALPSMTTAILNRMKVVLPDGDALKRFEGLLQVYYKQKRNLQHQNTLLARRRDLLLPRLMSGKLEVKP